jgi:S1-C subfamily serine protease
VADTDDDAIIMGYPGGGPLFVGPARVRDQGPISGPDFRNTRTVQRDVYALRGEVRSGNSGGPLFDPAGQVIGVVFASAIDDPATGYALTAQQVAPAAQAGAAATVAADTGPCE